MLHLPSFGMSMPGRNYAAGESDRYGFNGKENDKDITGGGQDYGMRIYDSRLGRFLSIDPLSAKFAMLTPYQFASNTPIWAIDLDGLEAATTNSRVQTLVIVIQGHVGTDPANGKTQAQNDANSNVDVEGIAHFTTLVKDKPEIQVVVYSSSQSENTKTDVVSTIKNFKAINPNGKVIIAGHSLGADNAVELVNENKDVTVDLLITLDIADWYDDDNIPANVKLVLNYYQTEDFPGGEKVEIDDPKKNRGANILSPGSTHTSIDNDRKEDVAKYILEEHKLGQEEQKAKTPAAAPKKEPAASPTPPPIKKKKG